jgi:ABC-type multidrug transport system ATPase subunit
MSLLELEHVGKRYRRGERVALDDVSLSIEAGELVTVWGERRSGRSTLLRIAAGIETPDTGVIRFTGRDVAELGDQTLGSDIAYCRNGFRASVGRHLVDLLAASQFARGLSRGDARMCAWKALARVAAEDCANRTPVELSGEEIVRVSIGRAIASEPRLIVIDEPTVGVDLTARDGILALLRSIADDGIAVLTSTNDGPGWLGADRVLALRKGKLRGETIPELAPVAHLDRHRQAHG